ncbi:MAG: hypothetical protein LBV45_03930 [Xanthomonadaceae bacterium]|nr:hypothetical protein [Xanthomonadaceae bacterium]
MNNAYILVSATCRNNVDCRFVGEDMYIDIRVQNNTHGDLALPLAYLKARGPIIRLIDRKTEREVYTRPNLADPALMAQLVTLRPSESAQLEWVITAFELQQFDPIAVDIDAEVSIQSGGRFNDEPVEVNGKDIIHISDRKERE